MIKLGLTGGIGSGKSTVAKVFQELGVAVYYADNEAKKFLFQDKIKKDLQAIFGPSVINGEGEVDKAVLASIVFTDEKQLAKLNALIHPLLENDFLKWSEKKSNEKYIVKEAAILFEAGFDKSVDKILTISAPVDERIERVMKRDQVNRQQVLDRISKQWTDEQREAKSDFTINNADDQVILEAILKIHSKLSDN
jgi:dephospho-CoA kinase